MSNSRWRTLPECAVWYVLLPSSSNFQKSVILFLLFILPVSRVLVEPFYLYLLNIRYNVYRYKQFNICTFRSSPGLFLPNFFPTERADWWWMVIWVARANKPQTKFLISFTGWVEGGRVSPSMSSLSRILTLKKIILS